MHSKATYIIIAILIVVSFIAAVAAVYFYMLYRQTLTPQPPSPPTPTPPATIRPEERKPTLVLSTDVGFVATTKLNHSINIDNILHLAEKLKVEYKKAEKFIEVKLTIHPGPVLGYSGAVESIFYYIIRTYDDGTFFLYGINYFDLGVDSTYILWIFNFDPVWRSHLIDFLTSAGAITRDDKGFLENPHTWSQYFIRSGTYYLMFLSGLVGKEYTVKVFFQEKPITLFLGGRWIHKLNGENLSDTPYHNANFAEKLLGKEALISMYHVRAFILSDVPFTVETDLEYQSRLQTITVNDIADFLLT